MSSPNKYLCDACGTKGIGIVNHDRQGNMIHATLPTGWKMKNGGRVLCRTCYWWEIVEELS